jgi:NADH-quinone oxidoreductase subunit N
MMPALFQVLPLVVIWLALGAVGIVIQAYVRSTKLVFGYYLGTLALTAVLAIITSGAKGTMFSGMITTGGYANYFDVLFCAAGVLSMIAARPYLQRMDGELDEYYTLLVSAVTGMMLMAHANHMLVTFIGIELMSISFYVMAGFLRSDIRSVEASLKYFLLGAFASGFLVYGMALIYGATGALDYAGIASVVTADGLRFPVLFAIGATLLVIGFCFKIAAFPFHQWAPDVYEGAPTAVTAFMSTAGKAAAFSALIPVAAVLMSGNAAVTGQMQLMVAVVAAITMLVGNISAIVQTNVKRMLAYSSVAHAGYMLMGIVNGSAAGSEAIVFYATAYTFMQIGAFVIVGILEREHGGHLLLDDYAGLGKRQPMLAALMAIFMFSLAGIPPLGGFFGKYLLFVSAIDAGYTWLTIVAVLSSVISVWFYLGLVVKMYFTEPSGDTSEAPSGIAAVTLAVTTVAVIALGVLPGWITSIIRTWPSMLAP